MFLAHEKRRSFQFVLLCAAYFLFSCSFNMPIPELPAYLSSLGGAKFLGLIISLFTLTAGLSRPFSGKLADTIGRIPVMVFGSLVCVGCSILYPLLSTVSGFLFLRFFHGLSTGFNPTGSFAYAADIIPLSRRGQAFGILGLCSTMGLAVGPALGSHVSNLYGISYMFYASSLSALISVIILATMTETLHPKKSFSWRHLKVPRNQLFEPRATGPAIVTFLLYASYGATLTLEPAVSLQSGLRNTGIFFTFFTIGSVGIRAFAGKIPDRFGRIPVLKVAGWVMLAGMAMIAVSAASWWLLSAALIYGLSMGLTAPAVSAWTIDLAHPGHRGRALSTMYIAMEAGIGLGALFSGWWYEKSGHGTLAIFLIMGLLALLSYLYLQFIYRGKPGTGKQPA
ncbi:MAG TPA: MFS transporter [Chitinophagaceae bacterium]|nr:MFS transporter [Chitinophagaceae bacterium]